jgi:hypothetical protein
MILVRWITLIYPAHRLILIRVILIIIVILLSFGRR